VQRTSVQHSDFVWYSRAGERQSKAGEPNTAIQPRLSPDGTRVLYSAADPRTGNRDIFVRDLARGITTQMVSHGANDWQALWSPDGKNVLFGSDRNGGVGLPSFIKSALGSSTPEIAFTTGTDPSDWSRDGRWIIGGGTGDIWSSQAVPGAKPVVLIPPKEGTYYNAASFSPDTRWITYVSSETGQPEVYVRAFLGTSVSPEAIRISVNGADYPIWNPAGGELFFVTRDSTLLSVDTRKLGRAPVPEPMRLFHLCEDTALSFPPVAGGSYMHPYDTLDGKHFLVNCLLAPPNRFTVLLNWPFAQR
jgi:Tol biopolymer transport system component